MTAFLPWIGGGGTLGGPFLGSLRPMILTVEGSVTAFLPPRGPIGTRGGPFSGSRSVPFLAAGGPGLMVLAILPLLLEPGPMPGPVRPFPRGPLGMIRSA